MTLLVICPARVVSSFAVHVSRSIRSTRCTDALGRTPTFRATEERRDSRALTRVVCAVDSRNRRSSSGSLPAEAIIERARAGDIDLVAMTTHGRSGISRLIFGSVAEQVLRHVTIPVLLVRPVAGEGETSSST